MIQTLPLNQYRLIRQLGAGAMGEVWLARDEVLNRDVAIKSLKVAGQALRDASEWFLREARAAARLNHPNVITIYQVLHDTEQISLVLELLSGGSLADELAAKGSMPWRDATAATRDATAGLTAAHAAGLVHRDIKPGNLLRGDRGTVKIADFGLVHVHEPNATLGSGMVLGTPSYMPPEQCRGDQADARSDLYALTCSYFELLTGRPPFVGETTADVLQQQTSAPFPDPRNLAPDLPDAVCRILFKGAQKDPQQRFQSAQEMLVALESLLHSPQQSHVFGSAAETLIPGGEMGTKIEPPNNLPQQLTSFVGREQEKANLRRTLRQNRLVTMLGAGGVGKTRLSLQVASELLDDHPGGVWFVQLAELPPAGDVLAAVATMFSVTEQQNRSLKQGVIDYLKPSQALLVLDNCEHVIAGAAGLASALLQGCPRLHVLATSREALGVAGEMVFPIPPLRLPDLQQLPALDQLLQYESVKLFADRAATVKPGFVLTAATGPLVAQICQRLDGIALAIELAAARVRVLSLEQLRQRLDDRFKLLTGGNRSDLPHHQTLRATIDWSHELLGDIEKILLRRLSVFTGGFDLDAVEAICSGDGLETFEVLDALTNLLDKSLINADESDGEMRYGMLQMVQQYASEKLSAAGEQATIARRHAEYFTQIAERESERIHGPEVVVAIQRLDREANNVRSAMAFAADSNDPAEQELGLRIGATLTFYWPLKGWPAEELGHLDRLLVRTSDASHGSLYGWALNVLGTYAARTVRELQWLAGRPRITPVLECREIFQRLGDEAGLGVALLSLAISAIIPSRSDRIAMFREAYDLLSKQNRPIEKAIALQYLGEMAMAGEDYDQARELLEDALQLMNRQNERVRSLILLAGPVARLHAYRPFENLQQRLKDSLDLAEKLKSPLLWRLVTNAMAHLHRTEGRLEQAALLYEDLLGHALRAGDLIGEGSSHYYLTQTHLEAGDFCKAEISVRRTLELATTRGVADNWSNEFFMSQTRYCQGDAAEAAMRAEQSMEKMALASLPEGHTGRHALWVILALARNRLGQGESAREALQKALEGAAASPDRTAAALVAVATCSADRGDHAQAVTLLAAVHHGFDVGRDLFPAVRYEFRQRIQDLRTTVPAGSYSEAWARGERLTGDQAIGMAKELLAS